MSGKTEVGKVAASGQYDGDNRTRGPISDPLVSIIVPVFNGARFLTEALDSILAQTYSRTEIIVMDDASTDATSNILAGFADRVRVIRQRTTRGIYGNANDGIALSRGEFIAVFHADDIYVSTIVEREVGFLRRFPEAGAVFCQDIFVDAVGREYGRLELPPEVRGERPLEYPVILNALLKYKNRFLVCPTCMVRSSVYRDVGVYRDKEFLNTSDMEMWLRIARRYPVGILEEYLMRYRHGHGSSSERYHRLRTDPERYFRIVDLYLEQGGREFSTATSLAAHEAHRAEDALTRGINAYILNQGVKAREILDEVRLSRVLAAPSARRGRLVVLFALLHCLVRIPRVPLLVQFLHGRQVKRKGPKGEGRADGRVRQTAAY